MKLSFIEDVSTTKWEQLVRNNENSYFYHTPMWAEILERVYGYKSITRLYEIDGIEVLIPLIQSKWHGFYRCDSTPMGYGGIFSDSELESNIIDNVLNDLKYSMGFRTLLCIIFPPPFFNKELHTDSNILSSGTDLHYTHILALKEGFDNIWQYKFTKKNRNMIRNAEKKGMEIFRSTNLSDIESYFQIYLDSTNRWSINNHHPFNLYLILLEYEENAKLWLARIGDTIIAGIITLEYGKNIISFGGASFSKFWRYSPNNLLYMHAIKYAFENGFKYFDFGQSGKLLGVRKFKESFGAERINLKKYIILSRFGRLGNMFFRKY